MLALIDLGSGFWLDFLWYTVWGTLTMLVVSLTIINFIEEKKERRRIEAKREREAGLSQIRMDCLSIITSGIMEDHFRMIRIHLTNHALRNMDLFPFQKRRDEIAALWNETVLFCLKLASTDETWSKMKAVLKLYINTADNIQKEIETLILDTAQQRSYHRQEFRKEDDSPLEERMSWN